MPTFSNQVLRLLERANTWTAEQIFGLTGTILIERNDVPLGTRTDRLENIGGNLYFNGNLLTSGASSGTVSSVALTLPSFLDVSGSPITSTGTFAVTLAAQTANKVLASATSGGAATPAFRALVAADIPDISATYATASNAMAFTNKTGNISQWTNNSNYVTTAVATLSSLASIGTITTGVWNGTVIAGLYGGTGVANSGRTITLGGNVLTGGAFTTAGAFGLTLTATNTTNVTLPTSGTLITSAVTTLSSLVSIGTITTGVWNGTTIGVIYGGTGLTTATQGDIIYASASNTWSKLAKNASATRYLSNTGSSNNPAWAQVDLTNGVTGVLPAANGGTIDTSGATNGQLLIGATTGTLALATITGTANQIVVTNGASSITLSTPQSIATASTPQFARLGLGTGAGATAVLTTTGTIDTGYLDAGNSGAALTINLLSGMKQKITLTANCTFTINNPISGTIYTLVLTQDGTGSRTVTWPATVHWPGGVAPTLTTTAARADIITLLWNGASYLGSSSLNYVP